MAIDEAYRFAAIGATPFVTMYREETISEHEHKPSVNIYSVRKKVPVYFLPLTLPNTDRFSKLFHRRT